MAVSVSNILVQVTVVAGPPVEIIIIMLYSAEMQEMREMGGIRITRCTEGLKTKPTAFNTELWL